jgi:hypothetical protein
MKTVIGDLMLLSLASGPVFAASSPFQLLANLDFSTACRSGDFCRSPQLTAPHFCAVYRDLGHIAAVSRLRNTPAAERYREAGGTAVAAFVC